MGSFEIGRFTEQNTKLEEWIVQLPRTLWELGSNHLATTEVCVLRRSFFMPLSPILLSA